MAGFGKLKASVMKKIDWLKGKLKRRSGQAAPKEERKLVIVSHCPRDRLDD
jgi:hypothetical protein